MGQKVNPHGARVGVIKDWSTRWYADKKNFADNLVSDAKLRKMIKELEFVDDKSKKSVKLYDAGISSIDIERRFDNDKVRVTVNQIDDLIGEINARTARNERVLVTTLTKKMAEDLTVYLQKAGIKVRYMHSDIGAMERMEIIRDMRMGKFDVLVGINLLREGLDLPEVSLVAILDADKEGFLRSETSLVQTIGRAARNADGLVILYADTVTPSMKRAMDETERRRAIQDKYNKEHGIVPQTIRKDVREILEISKKDEDGARRRGKRKLSERERDEEIKKLEKQMQEASRMLEFEYAAVLRDRIIELRKEQK